MRDDVDDPYAEDERSPVLAKLAGALRVVWSVVLYDGVPALLAWAVSAVEVVDVVSPFTDASLPRRLGRLGLFLSVIAAIITNESVIRLARPFGLGKFVLTVSTLGVALFPLLAAWHRLPLGLTPDQLAVVLSYAYLILKVAVGVLIGATVSWVLVGHLSAPAATPAASYTPRK